MQILRIILMVCFVFTAYTPIGEAVDMEAGDVEITDPHDMGTSHIKGSKTKSTLKATTSHPLSLNIDPNTEQIKTAPDAGENSNLYVEEGGAPDELEKKERQAGEPLHGNEAPSASDLTHLNERILQLQKKELDKSLDTSTEDDGY